MISIFSNFAFETHCGRPREGAPGEKNKAKKEVSTEASRALGGQWSRDQKILEIKRL